jgi:hypothetical protein
LTVIAKPPFHWAVVAAGIAGVPGMFARVVPVLRGGPSASQQDRRADGLRRGTQTMATCWALCVIPLLLPALGYLLLRLPATNRALWLSISHSASQIVDGLAEQQYAAAAVSAIGAVLAALSIAGSLYITTGLARRAVSTGRRWSAGRPDRGLVAVVAGAGSMAGLVAFWVAQGQFTGW